MCGVRMNLHAGCVQWIIHLLGASWSVLVEAVSTGTGMHQDG